MELTNLFLIMVRFRGLSCHYREYSSTARKVVDGTDRKLDGLVVSKSGEDIVTFENSLSKDSTTQIVHSDRDDGKLRRQCIAAIKKENSRHDPVALHYAKLEDEKFKLIIYQMVVGKGGFFEWHRLCDVPMAFLQSQPTSLEDHVGVFAALLGLADYISEENNYASNHSRSTLTMDVKSQTTEKPGKTSNKKRSPDPPCPKKGKKQRTQLATNKPDIKGSVQLAGLKIKPDWGSSSHIWRGTDESGSRTKQEVAVKWFGKPTVSLQK